MDARYCLLPSDWPCLGQSEWAAWIQVIGAMVALFLAIYVPIRMRRIDDLDRRRSAVGCLQQLDRIATYYATVIDQLENVLGTPFVDLTAALTAARAHLQNPDTPPETLPTIGHAVDATEKMMKDWTRAASDSVYRQNKFTVQQAREHHTRIQTHCLALQVALDRWRRKHWLSLAFT
ncbi:MULTISPECIES: hypothetical protein [Stenotrophomonas]|uniref:hypothetical protein n=1 Tax=Stenotrophomonas TaxID=40323 RepID=UPI00066DFCAA|nr:MULTISPECIES: hypothetical protein [Stenotrophomonas]MBA0354839.1 hypothetical protein [Stenotrophomonas maltophilia]MBH1694836.1 hypothetical protein [Stenotrophomonas maltophilia]MDH0551726.1 hypothetical protein [Stenotrophomonas sp. GD04006]PJL53674.1 hypothetical protein B9Y74_04715 [Stenotrophomonas maltophilia]HEL3174760.1 hypothetical protein [Stenotrophomonas maltophilia]